MSTAARTSGATNLYRTLGWKFAIPVGLIDVAKGAIPVVLLGPKLPGVPLFPTLCGVMAVVGHVYSVFVGFKGGKGVATAAGMLLGLAPEALGVALIVWLLLVRFTGYVSLGSVAGGRGFPAGGLSPEPESPDAPGTGTRCRGCALRDLEASREHSAPSEWNGKPLRPPRRHGSFAQMTAIGVLGAGSWGTTLADLLARKGLAVRLWAYEPEVVESINSAAGECAVPARVPTGEGASSIRGSD